MLQKEISIPDYTAAVDRAAYYFHPSSGYLRVSGADRLAFLQRQTTNDANEVNPGRIQVTVLTTSAARILDVFTVFDEDGSLGVVTLPENGQETFRFLRSRIFFMDKVAIEDASQEYTLVELVGPEAEHFIEGFGLTGRFEGDEMQRVDNTNLKFRIWLNARLGFRLLLPANQIRNLTDALKDFGANELADTTYDLLRIEAGIPAAGHELTEEYTPLETGLGQAISHTKGCYTGQEVIARQITYDKVTRQIIGLNLQGEVSEGQTIRSPGDNKPGGKITSYGESPRFGRIALGVVRKPLDRPGTRILIGDLEDPVQGQVTNLPFLENHPKNHL